MGGASQLGQPTGAVVGQLANSEPMPPQSPEMPPQGPQGAQAAPAASSYGGASPAPAPMPSMQPTQTAFQPQSGAMMGGGALSSAAAPNQAKSAGAAQVKFGGS